MKFLIIAALISLGACAKRNASLACDPAQRPNVQTGTSGAFSSPNFPDDYPNDQQCDWRVEVASDQFVELDFADVFLVEDCENCACDYLEIFDGYDDQATSQGRYCQVSPGIFVASSNYTYVRFVSDSRSGLAGWTLDWRAVGQPGSGVDEACMISGNGAVINETVTEGNITTPNYPQSYEPLSLCRWNIQAPAGMAVSATFNDFSLTAGYTTDYVEVFDGTNADAPVFGRITGSIGNGPMTFVTQSNNLFVRFASNAIGRGFHMSFKHIPALPTTSS